MIIGIQISLLGFTQKYGIVIVHTIHKGKLIILKS